MLPVEIFVYHFDFYLNFFQSWFLWNGNVVFFSVMIFFINFTFILSSGINICLLFCSFESSSYQRYWWSSTRVFSDSKSPQVSKIVLIILANFNNAEVWIVSSRPLISKSSRPFINPLVTVLSASTKIGIAVSFLFHVFFNSLARSMYLCFFFAFFQLYPVISRDSKVNYSFCWLSQGLAAWRRLDDPFDSQNSREVCASHSPGRILSCAYTVCLYGQI